MFSLFFLREPGPETMDLLQVMHQTEQVPLGIHFALAAQGETVQPQGIPHVVSILISW